MPYLIGSCKPPVGPIINIGVFPPGTLSKPLPQVDAFHTFPALIDTGASNTSISPAIVSALALQPIGLREVKTGTGSHPRHLFLIDMVIELTRGRFPYAGAPATEFSMESGGSFQMLIGMDVISKGTLVISPDGHFTFSL
jgi:Aspartyl protease